MTFPAWLTTTYRALRDPRVNPKRCGRKSGYSPDNPYENHPAVPTFRHHRICRQAGLGIHQQCHCPVRKPGRILRELLLSGRRLPTFHKSGGDYHRLGRARRSLVNVSLDRKAAGTLPTGWAAPTASQTDSPPTVHRKRGLVNHFLFYGVISWIRHSGPNTLIPAQVGMRAEGQNHPIGNATPAERGFDRLAPESVALPGSGRRAAAMRRQGRRFHKPDPAL